MYSSKFAIWLQHSLVGTNRDNSYRHSLLKENLAQRREILKDLKQYVQDAHEDAQRHLRELAGYSLNPFEDHVVDDDPAKGYPESLHIITLKGYFGEIFAAIIAQHFSPFEVANWEVPAFLFRFHVVELQHLEALLQVGGEVTRRPGRTGDDFLAFQRDSSGKIIRVLYGEAKCTADHDTDMIAEAYEKASDSPIVDFLRVIEILREKNNPLTEQWVDAIRRARANPVQYERYDLVSYICGRHPKRDNVWLPTDKPHASYTANRRLEAVEAHLYDVEELVRAVYSSELPVESTTQTDRVSKDETMVQPSKETLNLARNLRERLAGTTIPKSLAKLYSQHTRLGAGRLGLVNWLEQETTDCLDNALRLLEAAFAERESGNENWRESVRRAGEILEWLSHPQLNVDGLPMRFLAAAAYQLAGYPARSTGLLNTDSGETNESRIVKFLLKAEFPNLLRELAHYWGNIASSKGDELSLSWQNPDEISSRLQQRILKETVGALGVLCATMRWGDEPRLERAIAKLRSIGNVLIHGDDPYSWLLAKLCVEIAIVYTRTSMRYNLASLTDTMTDTGVTALERYLRQGYYSNKALAWPSQVKGIEKLVDSGSFVLCTPTGSGKTTIAELAILQSLFSDSTEQDFLLQSTTASLAIYLVPSRALATEVESKLSRVLRNLNEPPINVTGLYGGTDWGPTDAWLTAGDQTVLICTYEKAEALIRFLGPLFLHRVSLVVIDEAHSVQFDGPVKKLQQADNRALRLETLGSRLFTYLGQNNGRVIALSAVATGMERSLAGWVTGQRDASPAKTSYRSVRQLIGSLVCLPNHSFEIRYDLLDGASLKYKENNNSRREEQPFIPEPFPPLPHVEGYKTGAETRLRPYLFWAALHLASQDEEGRQHTVLISLMQNINGYARDLLELLDETWVDTSLPAFFQPPQEEEKVALWEKCLRSCEDYFGRDSKEYKLLQKGIVVHHGRMPGLLARSLVDLVQEQIVHLVLATSTLSEGVNLPFETILIPSLRRGRQPISVREFGNLVGRAGRPGYGTEGRSLVILDGENSFSAREYRKQYENLITQLKAQGQIESDVSQARSPLAELLLHLEAMWHRIPGVSNSGNFLNWLEQTEPLKIKGNLDEDSGLDAIETLDTLDSLLLSGIVEIEQLARAEVSADSLEEQLRQIWQRSYAYYAAQEENRLQEMFARRGRALKVNVYPNTRQRRRLYRAGLPPRSGNQLLELYPVFIQALKRGSSYAIWDEKDRFDYIQGLVDQLTSLSKYKREEKVGRSKGDWRKVLQWWLNPNSMKKEDSINVSDWYKYVSDNFGFRFNWGLGSIVALAADEALNGELLEPSLENWPQLGLPWIVLWLKELIIWGTLEPVAAYLLSKNMEGTRASAEEAAKLYYHQQPPEQEPNELLNASTIRDWAARQYSREQNLPYLRPPDRMQVKLLQDFGKIKDNQWRVFPVEVDNTLQWFDPSGVLLASCGRPSIWSDSFLNSYDFLLDVDEKTVSSESYTLFASKVVKKQTPQTNL